MHFIKTNWQLILIVLAGLLIRGYQVTLPLLTTSPNRELFTAYFTRDLFYRGNNPFTYFPIERPIEFPIYNILVSTWYPLVGVYEPIGRIVSVAAALFGFFLFLSIAKSFLPRSGVIVASIFYFLLSPMHVSISRSFQPDSLLLTLILYVLYSFIRYRYSGSSFFLYSAFISYVFALLIKPPVAILIAVAGYGFLLLKNPFAETPGSITNWHVGNFLKRCGAFMLFILTGVSISFAYLRYQKHLILTYTNLSPQHVQLTFDSYFELQYLLTPTFYINVFYSLSEQILTPFGILLSLCGLALCIREKRALGLVMWWLAVSAYVIASVSRAATHTYYLLPFVPVGSILASLAVQRILPGVKTLLPGSWAIFSILCIAILTGRPYLLRSYRLDPIHLHLLTSVQEMRQLIPPESKVITSSGRDNALNYYLNFPHSNDFYIEPIESADYLTPYEDDAETRTPNINKFETLKKDGFEYYAVSDTSILFRDEIFARHILKNYQPIRYSRNFALFYLKSATRT